MSRLEELRLLTKVAHLYYNQDFSQSDIASQLDLSQATISRLLKRAIAEKVVRISVSMPPGVHADLEEHLQAKYGLKHVIVVDCADNSDEAIQRDIGMAAAFYLENTLKKGEIIGISSWSATLLATVNAMRPLARPMDAQVVQLLGGIGRSDASVNAARLTHRLAELVHGQAIFLNAPGVVASDDAREVLLNDPFVSATISLFDRVTLALVGIGTVEPSKLLASSGNIFSQEELELLRERGAVGDMLLRFFDASGCPVHTPLLDRVIGMPLEKLKEVPRTMGIAGGERKVAAIHGALAGHWINILVTDRETSIALLQEL